MLNATILIGVQAVIVFGGQFCIGFQGPCRQLTRHAGRHCRPRHTLNLVPLNFESQKNDLLSPVSPTVDLPHVFDIDKNLTSYYRERIVRDYAKRDPQIAVGWELQFYDSIRLAAGDRVYPRRGIIVRRNRDVVRYERDRPTEERVIGVLTPGQFDRLLTAVVFDDHFFEFDARAVVSKRREHREREDRMRKPAEAEVIWKVHYVGEAVYTVTHGNRTRVLSDTSFRSPYPPQELPELVNLRRFAKRLEEIAKSLESQSPQMIKNPN